MSTKVTQVWVMSSTGTLAHLKVINLPPHQLQQLIFKWVFTHLWQGLIFSIHREEKDLLSCVFCSLPWLQTVEIIMDCLSVCGIKGLLLYTETFWSADSRLCRMWLPLCVPSSPAFLPTFFPYCISSRDHHLTSSLKPHHLELSFFFSCLFQINIYSFVLLSDRLSALGIFF